MPVNYPVEKIIDEEGNVLALVDVSARALLGDDELLTNAKTCTGGINELKQSLTNYETINNNYTAAEGVTIREWKMERINNIIILNVQFDITENKSNGDTLITWTGDNWLMKYWSYAIARGSNAFISLNCNGQDGKIVMGSTGATATQNWISATFVGIAKNLK